MSKQKFETVEQAVEEINKQAEEIKALKAEQKSAVAEAVKAKDEEIKTLKEQNGKAESGLEEALKEIEGLSTQLDAQSQAGAPSIVTIGNTKYRLAGKKVNVPGFGVLSVADLAKDDKALKHLAEIKSAVLVKV